jgi:hypothetical protein
MQPWHSNAQQPQPGERPQFAEDRGPPGKVIEFDGKRAMGYLKQICDIGPRISGSPGMAKQQELLRKHFESHGAVVSLMQFPAKQRSQPRPIQMANLLARWHQQRTRRILLCAHYDTRPIADQEPNPRDWQKPFLAANDGASGPALMMELAHHLPTLKLGVGIDFALFDGEEYIFDPRPQEQGGDQYFFGSERFAALYSAGRRKDPNHFVYLGAVLVDMVAGKNARFYYEQHSFAGAGSLVESVWKIASELEAKAFIPELKHAVLDDHLALLRAGIPAIDIIDFDYPHWHRLADVPDNCSAETLEQVGRVVAVWMQRAR